jgi:hypothetical protein
MPRSERGRIRGNCHHGIALPSLAQVPVAGEPLPAERLALVERPRRRGKDQVQGGPSAQTHSKDSGTTIPWARPPSEPPRFRRRFTKEAKSPAAPSVGVSALAQDRGWRLIGFWRLLPRPPATTDTRVLGLWSNPIACYGRLWAG